MKTKPIPAIVMLVAGLVVCIAGMAGHMETGRFVKMLLVVLIVFYIIGGIVKLLIDKNFKDMEEETTDGEETPAEAEEKEEPEQESDEQDIIFKSHFLTYTHNRNNLTTKVNYTFKICLYFWNSCNFLHADNVINIADINSILLTAHHNNDILFGFFFRCFKIIICHAKYPPLH